MYHSLVWVAAEFLIPFAVSSVSANYNGNVKNKRYDRG
jgi:hypothetical protein